MHLTFLFSLFINLMTTLPPTHSFLMTMPTNYCFVDNISICNSLEAIFYSYGIMMTQATWESPLPSTVMTIIPVTDDPNSVHQDTSRLSVRGGEGKPRGEHCVNQPIYIHSLVLKYKRKPFSSPDSTRSYSDQFIPM